MANADSTNSPSHPSSPGGKPPETPDSENEWALLVGAHLDGALRELLLALEKAPCLPPRTEVLARLGGAIVEVAKLAGVLEWLGEEWVLLVRGGAQ